MNTIHRSIFKAYDIRGIVDQTLTKEIAAQIGFALGKKVVAAGGDFIVVGRDGRLSGPDLQNGLCDGLRASGVNVIDIGMVVTPMTYFGTYQTIQEKSVRSSVMITGSHNPPNYNGFKMVVEGKAIFGDDIVQLYDSIQSDPYRSDLPKTGHLTTTNLTQLYFDAIANHIQLSRKMSIVVDCGNGVAGAFAKDLLERLGCQVQELFCEVDGHFPNHHPDPAHPENLQDLIQTVQQGDAEIGLAFDGDGDRLGVVTRSGQIIYPDRQMMLFIRDILHKNPGSSIIYDVKCTAQLAPWIKQHGGVPLMWKTGHSLVKAKLRETQAPFAGEMSGHLFFNDRWFGFDDGLYAAARLLEILSRSDNPSQLLESMPNAINTPELQIATDEGENHLIIEQLQNNIQLFKNAQSISTIDGIRIEYPGGFGLMRASNTTPCLVLRFEGQSNDQLSEIAQQFQMALSVVAPHLTIQL